MKPTMEENKITIASHQEIPNALFQAKEWLLAIRGFLWGHTISTTDEQIYDLTKQTASLITKIQDYLETEGNHNDRRNS